MTTFEEAIVGAVVQQFFTSHPSSQDVNGTVVYTSAPATHLAHLLFQQEQKRILEAVVAAMDMDDLSTKVATKVLDALTKSPSAWGWSSGPEAEFQKNLRERTIDILAAAKADELRASMEPGIREDTDRRG